MLYPCETVAACRDRKSVFNAAFCKRQAVNLSLGDDCCFIFGVALIHTEQNRHTVLFTPFLVFINTFDKFAVAIFYKLQDIVFIIERENNNIGVAALSRYVILSAYFFGNPSACHILNSRIPYNSVLGLGLSKRPVYLALSEIQLIAEISAKLNKMPFLSA